MRETSLQAHGIIAQFALEILNGFELIHSRDLSGINSSVLLNICEKNRMDCILQLNGTAQQPFRLHEL